MIKIKFIRLFIILLCALGLSGLIAMQQIKKEKNINLVAEKFGGDFTLTNHLEQRVTNKNFENQYRLIYFGFTYCPAICPTELQRITTVIKELGTVGDTIQPIFITIDPERDNVKTIKNYVELFHPRLTGLTGTPEEIDIIKKAYKIYAAKVQEENMSDYTMDHSSFIYFMGPGDSLIRIFKMDDDIPTIVKFIQDYMTKN